jgi:hypothetical protein
MNRAIASFSAANLWTALFVGHANDASNAELKRTELRDCPPAQDYDDSRFDRRLTYRIFCTCSGLGRQ